MRLGRDTIRRVTDLSSPGGELRGGSADSDNTVRSWSQIPGCPLGGMDTMRMEVTEVERRMARISSQWNPGSRPTCEE